MVWSLLEFHSNQNWLRLTALRMFLAFHTRPFQINTLVSGVHEKFTHTKKTCSYHLQISLSICDFCALKGWKTK